MHRCEGFDNVERRFNLLRDERFPFTNGVIDRRDGIPLDLESVTAALNDCLVGGNLLFGLD